MLTRSAIALPGYKITEQLYAGSRTLVYRAVSEANQQPVVIKLLKNDHPSFSELVQFRNQYIIAKNLSCPGIIQSYYLEPHGNGYALVMEDFGGISLQEYVKQWGSEQEITPSPRYPLPIPDFLAIALQLCDILHELCQNRVIHKDIKPANILINPDSKQVKLIDFSIASLLPRETQEIRNPNVLEGTLAYLSPEQTGRMNRGIDYRSDFYSLGVTFYELLTGQLPFQSNEPMELVHCHIAQQPPLIHKLNPQLPPILSEIVAKLMAKNAEDRYQSVLGLKHDLQLCLTQWQEKGLAWFTLGQRDISDRFLIPERLYGREAEVSELLNAFNRVSNGNAELLLVAGFSGIGKTAVINEVHKPIVRQRGYFIKGKFDQFQRNIPLGAFVQAFRDLMGQLLSESDAQLGAWKSKILNAVGENGQVILEVIPELEQIIGKQPPVPELSGSAAQNRFNLLFQKFIQVFTTVEHPLVVFIDDLQWADSASLNLLKLLMSEAAISNLLILGAYRDNEVFPAHPLMLTLAEIEKAKATLNTITLAALSPADINQLVADTLSCAVELARPLTELVYQKTQGNPFFTTQFLKALHDDRLITFDFNVGHWQCDITEIRALALTDDVVEFMALQLQKLPAETQHVLKLAACVGAQFDLQTLAIVSQRSPETTAADLWKALQDGLILPTSEIYKFFGNGCQTDSAEHSSVTPSVAYRFLHDRVQQAAYSLIPDAAKQSVHLKIGRLLLRNIPEADRENRILEIVSQLNVATDLISQAAERQELAQFNLMASCKAKAATAYAAALQYANVGIGLLAQTSWQSQYELTLALHQVATEAAYLGGELEHMEAFASLVLSYAKTPLDQVNIYEVKIEAFTAQGQFGDAISTALAILQQLGVALPAEPGQQDVEAALQAVSEAMGARLPADLLNLPEATDETMLVAARILTSVAGAAYVYQPLLYVLMVLRRVYLSIMHGNKPTSAFTYGDYAAISCSLGNVELGYELGQLAVELQSQQQTSKFKAATLFVVYAFTQHWKKHLREALNPLQVAYTSGLEVGNLNFAGYSAHTYAQYTYFTGQNLTQLEPEVAGYAEALKHFKQNTALSYCQLIRQVLLNLMGAENRVALSGDIYDEQQQLHFMKATGDRSGLAYLWIHKLVLSYLFSEFEPAVHQADQARQYLEAASGYMHVPIFYFYESLALLALFPQRSALEQQQMEERIAANQEKLYEWAIHAPMNFQHKYDLVEAERQRVLGNRAEAMDLYDRSITGAKEHGYIQEEALANELAARFYLDWNKERIAQEYLIEAYYCYARWGAKAKVTNLETRYPQLLAPILQQRHSPLSVNETVFALGTVTSTASTSSISDALDLAVILKASQTLSSEIELGKLLSTLLQLIVENAGADKCVLLLMRDERLFVKGLATVGAEPVVLQRISVEESQDIPLKLIYAVKNRLAPVVLMDATAQTEFVSDPYFRRQQPKSILCSPILHQGKLLGIVYLENNLTLGAFTNDRINILNLLCAQATISLENARLYERSQDYAQELEQSLLKLQQKSQALEDALTNLQQAQLQIIQSEKMSALGNLVAGIAHEINNPVGFIAGNLQPALDHVKDTFGLIDLYQQEYPNPSAAIQDEMEAIDLEYVREDLPKLINSMTLGVQRIRDISTSLRTFSRADRDYKVPFNIHDGIDSTILILKHRLKADGSRPAIEVVKEYGNLPLVECFPGQLNQVFMNILANAIDALEAGIKNKENSQFPPIIHIRTELSDSNQVAIRISDNGMGMTESVRQRVFDHLFTTKAVGKGTGLGLAIAHQIVVEKHSGKIEVNSTLGKGAEFVITL